jgi:hypothetical protein
VALEVRGEARQIAPGLRHLRDGEEHGPGVAGGDRIEGAEQQVGLGQGRLDEPERAGRVVAPLHVDVAAEHQDELSAHRLPPPRS